MDVSTKVTAATGAGTAAACLTTILFWALKTYAGADVPNEVQVAVVTLLTLVFTLAAGYWTVEANPSPSATQAVHHADAAARRTAHAKR